ncbi:MAG: hypothetical protein CME68_11330 [Halobacteriovoraceae bacterium]|nr:hypothetical protein [Halobacteriovoraceae bacterium]|tara:strand:- start:102 stop:479 length:378 start_codon:yes stop_codon:yes gene_type:complete
MERKKIIVILLLLVSFSLEIKANNLKKEKDFSIEIMGIVETPYDYIFRLEQKSLYPKVNLDCQSFFNGLHFLSKEEEIIDKIILDHHECEQLFLMIQKKEKESICLNVYLKEGNLSLDQSGSNCL